MSNLKYRVLIIVGLALAALWTLFPRTTIERVKRGDTFAYDTVKRVPLKLGLDLQGGMHLSLEVDTSRQKVANVSEAIDRAIRVVRSRVDEFGVAEPVIQKVGNERLIVELPGIDDPERAIDVVQQAAFLQFQITDESGALEKSIGRLDQIIRDRGLASAVPSDVATPATQVGLESLLGTDDSGQAGDSATGDSASAAAAPITGGPLSQLLQQGQLPGEYLVAVGSVPTVTRYIEDPAVVGALPPGKVLRWGSDSLAIGAEFYRPLYVLDSRPILTGEFLTDAQPNSVPGEGTIVQFTLNNEGGRRFRNETAKHIQDYMAIVLDDRVMGRPPIIQSAIGTNGQITMGQGRSLQEAQDLALVLRAGALPVPLKVAEVRSIGASLGADSIHNGMVAGIVAVGLVVAIMLGYYRFSGLLAVLGLVLYVLFTMGVLAGFNAVLTLPGLAGFVLSLGMAVDANVLVFERIREELDRGKTVRTAIDEGFEHAVSAIIDTSVTTILTAAVLYQYGTGPVRGFAVTLIAGIVASVFTALFVVRTFYLIWLNRTRGARALSI